MIERGIGYLNALPPNRVLSMRYETVLSSPERELRRLIRFVGPEFENSPWLHAVIALVQKKPPNYTRLEVGERARLAAACEPALTLLGYTSERT